jgi:ribonuclease P protein component
VVAYVSLAGEGRASRLGLAIRCRRAVDRNLLKRRLRSAWRSFEPQEGFDVAVRVDEAALALPYQELETHAHAALARAGLGRRS